MQWALNLIERGWIPDPLLRRGIRRLLETRIREISSDPDPTTPLVEQMRQSPLAIETETANRHTREGTQPLGTKAILARDPHHRPLELKKSRAPAFHAATKAARRELVEAFGWFLSAYHEAAVRLRQGDLQAGFPEGSFPPRLPFVAWVPDPAPG